MNQHKKGTLTAAALLLSVASASAEEIYTLPTGSTSGGIDLTAMSGYYADRVNTPPANTDATISGGLTVSPESNPFTIYAYGCRTTFADSPKIETYPIELVDATGGKSVTEFRFWNPDVFRKDYHIGVGIKQVVDYGKGEFSIVGDGTNYVAKMRVDGEIWGMNSVKVGRVDETVCGNADMYVGKNGFVNMPGYTFYMGYQHAALADGFKIHPTLDIDGKFSCGRLDFGNGMEGNYDSESGCFVTNRGAMTVTKVYAYGGGWHRLVLDGGTLTATSSSDPIFRAEGCNFHGGYPNPRIFIECINGQPFDLTLETDRDLCTGWDYRPIRFTGTGGFIKRGAGILTFTHNTSYYWDDVSTRFGISGTTTVKGGGIKLVDNWFSPGRGRLVMEGDGTTYDINGVSQTAAFTGATGAGSIVNSSSVAAWITFGYNNASDDMNVAIGERVNVWKNGSGTLTVGENASSFAGNLTVSNGIVKLATDMIHLGKVTIANGATLDVRGHAFACTALNRDVNGKILMDAESSVTVGGDGVSELSMPAAMTSFEKTGAGMMTVWGSSEVSDGVTISGGTLLVRPRDYDGKYYRIRLYANSDYPKNTCQKLSEFTFVDANDNRIAIPGCFWNPIDGIGKQYYGENVRDGIDDASTLQECEAQLWGKGGKYYESVKSDQGPEKLFDNDTSTIHAWWYYWGSLNVVVRLPNDAPAVAGYKMTRAKDGEAPITWSLEGSLDGKAWTTLDNVSYDLADSNQLEVAKAALPMPKKEYNNGAPYRLASLTNNTCLLPFGSHTPVKVTSGAVYAAVDSSTRIDALSVDFAQAGRGTVSNFTFAANGVMTLANYAETEDFVDAKIDAVSMFGVENLKTWSVIADGETRRDLRVRLRDGKLVVMQSCGMLLIFR